MWLQWILGKLPCILDSTEFHLFLKTTASPCNTRQQKTPAVIVVQPDTRRVTHSSTLGKGQCPPSDTYVENAHLTDLANRYGLQRISCRI